MKKIIMIVIMLSVFNYNSIVYGENSNLAQEDINGEAAILIDGKTGDILFEKNMNKKMYPASTTKMLTGILAIEQGNMDKLVTVDDDTPYEIYGTHIALEPGEQLRFKELLNATLIESANDAAVVIAKDMAGDVESFAKMMNKKAKEIGALNSNFVNPSGLHDDNHFSTAYDLAMIAKYGMQNDQFRNIVKNYKYTIEPTNIKTEKRVMYSANKLLYSTKKINVDGKNTEIKYDNAIGVKTGYTEQAGNSVVSAVEKDGRLLISVVLKSAGNNLWIDTHKLLNYGLNNFDKKLLGFKNEFVENIKIENGNKNYVTGVIGENVTTPLKNTIEGEISKKVNINKNIKAPIEKGQVLGNVEYVLNGETIKTANIISAESINLVGSYANVGDISLFKGINIWWIIGTVLLLLFWRINVLRRRARKRRRYRNKSYNI